MKHLRKFNSVSDMESAIEAIDIDFIGLAYNGSTPVMCGTAITPPAPPQPITATPFYVENITQENETLTISSYDFSESEPASYLEIPVEYSTDGTAWSSLGTTGETPLTRTLQPGDKVYLRATTNAWYELQEEPIIEHGCTILGVSKVGGNVMSLLYGSSFTGNETTFPSGSTANFIGLFVDMNDEDGYNRNLVSASELILPATTLTNNCYTGMFQGCTSLTTAPALPATTLTENCYIVMFQGCTSLTAAPALPATTLTESCYSNMFEGCTSLTTAPALPATTLAYQCYYEMFYNCTSLTTAPALPATTLAPNCYQAMFWGCTSLATAPALPATTLVQSCYSEMFYGCTSLTTAPALPATELAERCYNNMFLNCTSLVTAPALPATTLTENCYTGMFYGCTSLTTAPALPATTLAAGCYEYMFNGCTALTTSPELSATKLAESCCNWMFANCTLLTTAPELLATTLTDSCYSNMFDSCTSLNNVTIYANDISAVNGLHRWLYNVAESGTFHNLGSATYPTGDDGIPSGWTVENV